MRQRLLLTLFSIFIINACGGGGASPSPSPNPTPTPSPSASPTPTCSQSNLETDLDNALSAVNSSVDFSLYLENNDSGASYRFERGSSTLQTSYESASTSKWVSAAVILWLVDAGTLNLNDSPQDYLSASEWPLDESDNLRAITLAQLLSFTSGLEDEALCQNLPNFDFFSCVANIANANEGTSRTPGDTFYYSSSHLQVAGAMAIRAGAYSSWEALFNAFKNASGLFSSSEFNLPSNNNPRLAGGMTWTGDDYSNFLRAYLNSDFYSSDIATQASNDQRANASTDYSPALAGIGEDWHYGYGQWIECHNSSFNCTNVTQISSPGAYGAYPFINFENNYFGILAREGTLGTFVEGYEIFDSVRTEVEAWAACPNP